jgi:hypothetical protein
MRGSPPSTVPTSCRFACLGEVCKCDTTCPFESAFFAPQMARECEGGMRHRTAVVHAPELLHCQEHVYIIAGHGNAGSGCTVRVGCAAWRVHVCVCVCVGVCLFSRVPIFFALSSSTLQNPLLAHRRSVTEAASRATPPTTRSVMVDSCSSHSTLRVSSWRPFAHSLAQSSGTMKGPMSTLHVRW